MAFSGNFEKIDSWIHFDIFQITLTRPQNHTVTSTNTQLQFSTEERE